jgi:hypothetical protein
MCQEHRNKNKNKRKFNTILIRYKLIKSLFTQKTVKLRDSVDLVDEGNQVLLLYRHFKRFKFNESLDVKEMRESYITGF